MQRALLCSVLLLLASVALGQDQPPLRTTTRLADPTTAPSAAAGDAVADRIPNTKSSRLRKVIIVPAANPVAPTAGWQLTFAFFSPTRTFAVEGVGDAPNAFIKFCPLPTTPLTARETPQWKR